MRAYLLLVLFLSTVALAHGRTKHAEAIDIIAPQEYAASSLAALRRSDGALDTLRLTLYTNQADSAISDSSKRAYMKSIIESAKKVVQSMVGVYRITSSLKVSRSCASLWSEGELAGKCKSAATSNPCGLMQNLPSNHLAALTVWKEDGTTEEVASGPGVANTDLLVYITGFASCDPSGPSTELASGNVCQRDQFDRPVAGYVNICPNQIKQALGADPAQEAADVASVVHELVHILGMSSRSWALFYDEDGAPRTPRCPENPLCGPGDVSGRPPRAAGTGEFVVSSQTVNGSLLVTPSVQHVTRAHFGCPEAEGAALEVEDGEAVAHWLQAALMPELMAEGRWPGVVPVVSAFTLALLQDSGWYQVNISRAGDLQWGRGQGCAFAQGACQAVSGACEEATTKRVCAFQRKGIGQCTADGWGLTCPIADPVGFEGCAAAPSGGGSCGGADCAGSAYGAEAACFESTLLLDGFAAHPEGQGSAGCYRYRCVEVGGEQRLEVQLPDARWRVCAEQGQPWQAEGYSGAVECPAPEAMCVDQGAALPPALVPFRLDALPEEAQQLPESFFNELSVLGWVIVSLVSLASTIVIYVVVAWWRWRNQATSGQFEAIKRRLMGKKKKRKRWTDNDEENPNEAAVLKAQREGVRAQADEVRRQSLIGGLGLFPPKKANGSAENSPMPGLVSRSREVQGASPHGNHGEGNGISAMLTFDRPGASTKIAGVETDEDGNLKVGGVTVPMDGKAAVSGQKIEFTDPKTGKKRRGSLVGVPASAAAMLPADGKARRASAVSVGDDGVMTVGGATIKGVNTDQPMVGGKVEYVDAKGRTRRGSLVVLPANTMPIEASGGRKSSLKRVSLDGLGNYTIDGVTIPIVGQQPADGKFEFVDPVTGKKKRGSLVAVPQKGAAAAAVGTTGRKASAVELDAQGNMKVGGATVTAVDGKTPEAGGKVEFVDPTTGKKRRGCLLALPQNPTAATAAAAPQAQVQPAGASAQGTAASAQNGNVKSEEGGNASSEEGGRKEIWVTDPRTGRRRRGSVVSAVPIGAAGAHGEGGHHVGGLGHHRGRRLSIEAVTVDSKGQMHHGKATKVGQHIKVLDPKTGKHRRRSVVSVEAVEDEQQDSSASGSHAHARQRASSEEPGAHSPAGVGAEIAIKDPRTGKNRRGSVVAMQPAGGGGGKRSSLTGSTRRRSVASVASDEGFDGEGSGHLRHGSEEDSAGGHHHHPHRGRRKSVDADYHLKHFGEKLAEREKHIGLDFLFAKKNNRGGSGSRSRKGSASSSSASESDHGALGSQSVHSHLHGSHGNQSPHRGGVGSAIKHAIAGVFGSHHHHGRHSREGHNHRRHSREGSEGDDRSSHGSEAAREEAGAPANKPGAEHALRGVGGESGYFEDEEDKAESPLPTLGGGPGVKRTTSLVSAKRSLKQPSLPRMNTAPELFSPPGLYRIESDRLGESAIMSPTARPMAPLLGTTQE